MIWYAYALSPNSTAKVIIDGAEFIIEPSVPKQLEPVEEPKHDILAEMMKIRESVQKRPKPVCTGFYMKKICIYWYPAWGNSKFG